MSVSPSDLAETEKRDAETGVPALRTWRGVYVFVLGTFVVVVGLLAWFTHAFR